MDLYDLIGNLKDVGFYDILLPWALFFAMIYGLLTTVGPFKTKGDDGKTDSGVPTGIPAIISMAVAFFIIAYTPFGLNFGSYLAILFGKSGTILVSLLMIVIFLGMAGINLKDEDKNILGDNKVTVSLVILAIVALIYFGTGNIFGGITIPGITEETLSTLILLGVLVGGILLVMKKKD